MEVNQGILDAVATLVKGEREAGEKGERKRDGEERTK